MPDITALNDLAPEQATSELLRCCGSAKWADLVARGRPYTSYFDLIIESRRQWLTLNDAEWRSVLAAHDRLGIDNPAALSDESRSEQQEIYQAEASLRGALAMRAVEYERRHGFMFVTLTAGRSVDDIFRELNVRITNARTVEFSNAILQHQLIAERRLAELYDTTDLDTLAV